MKRTLLIIVVCLLFITAFSQSFGPEQTIFQPDVVSPGCTFSIDIDGNGNKDVLSASFNDDKVAALQSYSQPVPDSVYYQRLFYLGKVWGHAKYYHTEIANGSINWDDELLRAINGAKYAPTNASFNDSIQMMLNNAGDMGISTSILPDVPDSLNNNTDLNWIQNPIFSDTVRALLDTIRVRFRPQNNVYLGQAFPGGNPTFDNDDLYYIGANYPSEEKRILALFRYWNIINYLFPYKYMMDQDWDTTLIEFIPKIIESIDELSYNLNFKQLTTRINDSHAFFSSPVYLNWNSYYYPPFLVRYIENEMVITKVKSDITEVKIGDIIKEIDSNNIYTLRDSMRKYSKGSNNVIIEDNINQILMWGNHGDFQISIDDGVNIQTKTLFRNSFNFYNLNHNFSNPIWKDTTINNSCNFGIVDMGQLEISDISNMFNDLWDTDAIIFDIRNYPNNTLWYIVNYLFPDSIHIANFTVPDITYPGRLYWHSEYIGSGTSNPYSGKIILLFDERTISQAEYTCMGLEQFPGAIKIGSTTAAADGNASKIYLPGRIYTVITGLGTFYPDYTETQRVGIIPDYEVHPTILGIRAGHDEVLDFALNCSLFISEENIKTEEVKLYPNPVSNTMKYELSTFDNSDIILFEIIDIFGRTIKTIEKNKNQGVIDFSGVNRGTYIVKITTNKKILTKIIIKY